MSLTSCKVVLGVLVVLLGGISHAYAANNCIQLYRGEMNELHEQLMDCEATGMSGIDCRQSPDLLTAASDIAQDWKWCNAWSPEHANSFPYTAYISIDCVYNNTPGSEGYDCQITEHTSQIPTKGKVVTASLRTLEPQRFRIFADPSIRPLRALREERKSA